MDEYISKETAINVAKHAWNEWNLAMAAADGKREVNLVYKRQELCKAVESVFLSVPVADVAPVVHTRWEYIKNQNKAVCMNCGFERDLDDNFGSAVACPNCGAKMDEGEEERNSETQGPDKSCTISRKQEADIAGSWLMHRFLRSE
ncbi:MAG: hypothetical protein Q3Y08_04995 [Butyricicoccus sp.]|nr:hypothetical protein [Butyricicoccus sp.]